MMLANKYRRLWQIVTLVLTFASPSLTAQSRVPEDPVTAAQARAAQRATLATSAPRAVVSVARSISDPIIAAQVLAAAEKTFPNLAAELENADLLRKAAADPSMRGNLRGRIAESDWINRNEKNGWKPVKSRNAPQNDAWRRLAKRGQLNVST